MQLRKILLADDDAEDRSIIQDAMELLNAGDVMQFADNGEEVLNFLEKNSGDLLSLCLIVLDLNMPKMGGIEFLRELRKDPAIKAIPVIVLTTSNEDKDKVEAYNMNVAGYIVKPVTFSKFVEAVATLNKYWTLSEMP